MIPNMAALELQSPYRTDRKNDGLLVLGVRMLVTPSPPVMLLVELLLSGGKRKCREDTTGDSGVILLKTQLVQSFPFICYCFFYFLDVFSSIDCVVLRNNKKMDSKVVSNNLLVRNKLP